MNDFSHVLASYPIPEVCFVCRTLTQTRFHTLKLFQLFFFFSTWSVSLFQFCIFVSYVICECVCPQFLSVCFWTSVHKSSKTWFRPKWILRHLWIVFFFFCSANITGQVCFSHDSLHLITSCICVQIQHITHSHLCFIFFFKLCNSSRYTMAYLIYKVETKLGDIEDLSVLNVQLWNYYKTSNTKKVWFPKW